MTFLLINRHFGGDHVPTGRMLADVARGLKEKGHEVSVFSARSDYAGICSGDDERHLGIQLYRAWSAGEKYRLWSWVVFLVQCHIAVAMLSWDRCVLLTDPPFLGCVSATATLFGLRRKPVYWWTMDLYPEALVACGVIKSGGLWERVLRLVNEVALRFMRGIICLDDRQRRRLSSYKNWNRNPDYSSVVSPWDARPLGVVRVEGNRFLRLFPELVNRKIALYAGNLGEAHSFGEIVAAAQLLGASGRDDWMFIFAIRGAQRKALEITAKSMHNIMVMDYQPAELTSDMLSSATVHIITMRKGWEGVVVPSKLYGVVATRRPVLYIGPSDSGTAHEIKKWSMGQILEPGVKEEHVVEALDKLSVVAWKCGEPPAAESRIEALVRFISE